MEHLTLNSVGIPLKKLIINNKNIAILFNNIIGSIIKKQKVIINYNNIKKVGESQIFFFIYNKIMISN
jgi:hypothetical protein